MITHILVCCHLSVGSPVLMSVAGSSFNHVRASACTSTLSLNTTCFVSDTGDTDDIGHTSYSSDALSPTQTFILKASLLLALALSLASGSDASFSFLRIKNYLAVALLSLMELSMLFLLPQHLHVPQNSLTRVAVLICVDGSLGREFADREGGIGGSDWACSEIWHGAVPTHISEELLDTHLASNGGID
jgi:hypothetical protein